MVELLLAFSLKYTWVEFLYIVARVVRVEGFALMWRLFVRVYFASFCYGVGFSSKGLVALVEIMAYQLQVWRALPPN